MSFSITRHTTPTLTSQMRSMNTTLMMNTTFLKEVPFIIKNRYLVVCFVLTVKILFVSFFPQLSILPLHSLPRTNCWVQCCCYTETPQIDGLQKPAVTLSSPDMMVSVMFRLLRDSPKDWREEDEEVLEVSEGGRAVFTGVAVGVALPLDFRRSFSAFSISISFCVLQIKKIIANLTQTAFKDTDWQAPPTADGHFLHCCYSESVSLEL